MRSLERGTAVLALRARITCRVRVRAYVWGAGRRRLRSRSVVRTIPARRQRIVVLRFGPRGTARLRATLSRSFFLLAVRYRVRVLR